MLYLISYEGATPGQDQLIQDVLRQRNAVKLPGNTWIFESRNENVLTALWSIRCGENVRILVADVSQAHFATSPYSDVRGLLRTAIANAGAETQISLKVQVMTAEVKEGAE